MSRRERRFGAALTCSHQVRLLALFVERTKYHEVGASPDSHTRPEPSPQAWLPFEDTPMSTIFQPTYGHIALIPAILLASCASPQITPKPPSPAAPTELKQPAEARVAGFAVGIAYSGYRHGQHPDRGQGAIEPSTAQILEDLRLLTRDGQFGLIRLYDAGKQADRVLQVIREHDLPLKVMQGAWLQAEASNHLGCAWLTAPIPEAELAKNRTLNAAEVDRVIRLAKAYPKIIVAVNVGNEVLVEWTDHLVPVPAMRAHLAKVKGAIAQPVTIADNYVAWTKKGPALRDIIDFAAVHTYPAWEERDVDVAMPYTIENLEAVQAALPGLRLAIGEAGWPSIASEFGPRASQAKQKQYYEALTSWAAAHNITTFVFEAFDEDWKGNPSNPRGAEKHWGLFNIARQPKEAIRSLYPDLSAASPRD